MLRSVAGEASAPCHMLGQGLTEEHQLLTVLGMRAIGTERV